MADRKFVQLEHDGPVAIVTLNRPDRLNAMGDEMDAEFWSALEEVRGWPDARVIVWRAEGRAFCAGRDLNDLGQNRPEGMTNLQFITRGHAYTHELLVRSRLPIVVGIQGWCIGGGFERTLLCDLRVASDDAKFRLPELLHGVICDSGGTARLFQMCGHGLVADLVMTGRTLTAEEALHHGIVSRVVPRDRLDDEVMEVATTIAKMPPLGVRLHRELVAELGRDAVATSIERELLGQMVMYNSEDFAELRAARAEEREPVFRGT
jgi:enoyl-CoA hydratase/carnithine racemase